MKNLMANKSLAGLFVRVIRKEHLMIINLPKSEFKIVHEDPIKTS